MMKVLILEDRGSVQHFLNEYLLNAGYEVRLVGDIYEATQSFLEMKPDALIVDLNMDPDGLDLEIEGFEACAGPPDTVSRGGMLTGWVWLQLVYKRYPEYRKRTIIYSAFLSRLTELVNLDDLADITCIGKRDDGHVGELLSALKSMAESQSR